MNKEQKPLETATEHDKQLWENFKKAWEAYRIQGFILRENAENLPAIIRYILSIYPVNALISGGLPEIINFLNTEELIEILPQLLTHAIDGSSNYRAFARHILKLPKEWLIANIERYAEPILNAKNNYIYIEYGNLLPLYFDIDLDLTKRLIERAIAHPNPDVQEHGREWLEYIKNDKGISGDKNE